MSRLLRLSHWLFRIRMLPDYKNRANLRPPTFNEAWHGISNT